MEREDYVSLWLGNLNCKEDLDNLMEVKYTRSGRVIQSKFGIVFNILRYDDDFREVVYLGEKSKSIFNLLENFSYDNVLLKYFIKEIGEEVDCYYNTVILLYNFDYDGKVGIVTLEDGSCIKYIGKTKYRNLYR